MKKTLVVVLTVLGIFFLYGSVQADLSDGLVAYYPFDGDANDGSGNGNDGTVNGATLTTDRFGNANSAYDFDGNDDYIEIPHSNDFMFDNSFSIAFWLKPDTYQYPDYGFIITKTRSVPGVGNGVEWMIYFLNEILVSFWEYGSDVDETISIAPPENSLGEWNFVVVSYDSVTSLHSVYWNGDLLVSQIAPSDPEIGVNGPVWIGASFGYGFFDGILDDIRVYNSALTKTEIQQLYWGGGIEISGSTNCPPSTSTGSIILGSDLSFTLPDAIYQPLIGNEINLEANFIFFGEQDGKLLWELDSYTVE